MEVIMPEERTNSQIEGILNSVKHMLGPEVDFEEFDSDIIIAINMAFSILYDQGLEKDGSPIMISGPDERWDEFITDPSILAKVKEVASPYTMYITDVNPSAILPNVGLDKLIGNNKYVTIAVPLALVIAIVISIILNKTKLGYELKATGSNKNAARYAGMKENQNIILTLVIAGGLAGLGASMLYQTGYMRWECTQSSVPGMGFNGIAAAFLGGLSPIGAIFSSFFIQHITDGGQYVNTNFYSSQISDLISSVIIYLCGFVLFIKITMNNMIAKSEDRRIQKQKTAEAA
jgi:simple sugar transport system permease protein